MCHHWPGHEYQYSPSKVLVFSAEACQDHKTSLPLIWIATRSQPLTGRRMGTAEAGACLCRGWGYLLHWLSSVLWLSYLLPLGTSLYPWAIGKTYNTIFLLRKWSQDYKSYKHVTKQVPPALGHMVLCVEAWRLLPLGPAPASPAPGVGWRGLHPWPPQRLFPLCPGKAFKYQFEDISLYS